MAFIGGRVEGGGGVVDRVDCVLPAVRSANQCVKYHSWEVFSLLWEVLSDPVGVLFLHLSHYNDLVANHS